MAILTTTGAKTGNIRKNPVMRIKQGHTYVAVASNAGATSHPSWYRNLIAHPQVSLQDGATVYRLRAREADGEDKAHWWGVAEPSGRISPSTAPAPAAGHPGDLIGAHRNF